MEATTVPEIQPEPERDAGTVDVDKAPSGLLQALQAQETPSQSVSVPLREEQVANAVAFLTHANVVVRCSASVAPHIYESGKPILLS